jgi:hypothetical protein
MDDRAIWDSKADSWDDLHGEDGNDFHHTLVSPPVERLLALRPGERVLDIAWGTGMLARPRVNLCARCRGAPCRRFRPCWRCG